MTLLNEQLLDALRVAGVPEKLAREAATSVGDATGLQREIETLKRDMALLRVDVTKLQRDLAVLTWTVRAGFTATFALLLPMFFKLMWGG